MKSYVPCLNPENLCEALQLCSVRKKGSDYLVGKKDENGHFTEIPFSDVVNTEMYEGKTIVRTYSSGHVFLDATREKVWLVTTEKDSKIQHQFTGGSPTEDINKEVFYTVDSTVKIHLDRVEDNAMIRTLNRTGARVTEVHNEIPLVDWVIMESQDEKWESYWKLICLMHYVVRQYEWALSFKNWVEYVTSGDWYAIDDLPSIPHVAPNIFIVAKKARELTEGIQP
jgi:hypothetical protein